VHEELDHPQRKHVEDVLLNSTRGVDSCIEEDIVNLCIRKKKYSQRIHSQKKKGKKEKKKPETETIHNKSHLVQAVAQRLGAEFSTGLAAKEHIHRLTDV
jgi:hypothetical protein